MALILAAKQNPRLLLGLFALAKMANTLATNFGWLLIFRALVGIGAGVYIAMGISVAALISKAGKQGKSIAMIMAGMANGVVFGVPNFAAMVCQSQSVTVNVASSCLGAVGWAL